MAARVYITGAAGSGTSTLGRALADRLGVQHLDTDDYFWAPVDPPYSVQRTPEDRLALLAAAQAARGGNVGWVLSGAVDGWGDHLIDGADLIVFLRAPMAVRISRLRRREQQKFGDRIKPNGDMYIAHHEFIKWAASYDDVYFRGRSLSRHLAWLAGRSEKVLEMSGTDNLDAMVLRCSAALG